MSLFLIREVLLEIAPTRLGIAELAGIYINTQ